MTSGVFNSFLAAIQASLSVLLVIFYGGLAAKFKLLDGSTAKTISKLSVRVFLPALLFVKIGSELHLESASRYGIILIWAILAHLLSFLIGLFAHRAFGFPDWITVAIMFNNTTSYPLLLVQALDQTGILSGIVIGNETTTQSIERAKSYFLVFATVSSCLTFAVGPRLIDSEHAPEPHKDLDENEAEEVNETSALLVPSLPTSNGPALRRRSVILQNREPTVTYDRRPSVLAKSRWTSLSPRTRWWLLFVLDFFNAPLLGAVAGAVVGLIPLLHKSFFNDTEDGGIFTAWFTASIQTIGSIFVPLPILVAGVSLYTNYASARAHPNHSSTFKSLLIPTIFILVIRFVVWPVISISVIYGLAKRTTILGDDPMLWFALMMMPTGPPAMKLITMVQASDGDEEEEHKIATLLTVSTVMILSTVVESDFDADLVYHITDSRIYSRSSIA
jgi:predicted permease